MFEQHGCNCDQGAQILQKNLAGYFISKSYHSFVKTRVQLDSPYAIFISFYYCTHIKIAAIYKLQQSVQDHFFRKDMLLSKSWKITMNCIMRSKAKIRTLVQKRHNFTPQACSALEVLEKFSKDCGIRGHISKMILPEPYFFRTWTRLKDFGLLSSTIKINLYWTLLIRIQCMLRRLQVSSLKQKTYPPTIWWVSKRKRSSRSRKRKNKREE